MKYPIDIVVPWVDGSDPEWRKSKSQYSTESELVSDSSESRYRDWGTLRYWFRGVEKYLPWIRYVFFITCGQCPVWLNTDAPKLKLINHCDYMKPDYIPTFSANPIEMNIQNIEELSEYFIYTNDDFFFTKPCSENLFFQDGLPKYAARLHSILPKPGVMAHEYMNDVQAINRHFNYKESIRKNAKKWFSIKDHSFRCIIENLIAMQYHMFPGFENEHMPVPFRKNTLKTVWENEYELLDSTSRRKFRDIRDVNQYLYRYWELASGTFYPTQTSKYGRYYILKDDNKSLYKDISTQRYNMICINDMDVADSNMFEQIKNELISAFETILPEKSSFEK